MKKFVLVAIALFSIARIGGAADVKSVASLGEIFDYNGTVYFTTNGSAISPEDDRVLRMAADVLKKNPAAVITVAGHTDARGSNAFNQKLSARRAAAVKQALVKSYGADASRVRVAGFGEDHPVASNDTEEGRAKNRRVEIILSNPGTPNIGNAFPGPTGTTIERKGDRQPNVGTSYPEQKEAMQNQGTQKPNVGTSIPAPNTTEDGRRETR